MRSIKSSYRYLGIALLALGAATGIPSIIAVAAPSSELTGAQEVPPVDTAATAVSHITVGADLVVSGTVDTKGIKGTAAHIHQGAAGTNGPPIITLVKSSDNQWTVPAGATFTPTQFKTYKAGGLYVNVHSAEHPSGEIRMQMMP